MAWGKKKPLPSSGSGNNRRQDRLGDWSSGHNGENEDHRVGRKARPNVKSKGNTNRKKK